MKGDGVYNFNSRIYYTVLISTIEREIERYRGRELKKGGEWRKKRERERTIKR